MKALGEVGGGRVCEWEDGVHTKPRGCGWGFVIHCDGAIKSQTGNLGVWGRGIGGWIHSTWVWSGPVWIKMYGPTSHAA